MENSIQVFAVIAASLALFEGGVTFKEWLEKFNSRKPKGDYINSYVTAGDVALIVTLLSFVGLIFLGSLVMSIHYLGG